ncbi:MAG TPA: extracellular solute-binding protein [Stellaceae bacterium]|jgi:ABC-type Fe3+ transport system substrate-binding protein
MRVAIVVGLCGALAAMSAQAQTPLPELAKIIAAAEQEGKVTFRATNTTFAGPIGARVATDGINRMFGTHLTVDWVPGPAYGPLAAILYQELQAGQPASTDVYVGTAAQVSPNLEKGLFRQVDWPQLMPERIPAAIVEGDGRALRYSGALPGVLYNVKAATWAPGIANAADLLKPELRGQFYTTPFLGGFDVLLATDVWGVAKTTEYVTKLSGQIAGLAGCEATDRIASGELPALAIDCSGSGPNRQQYRGKNVLGNQVIADMAQLRYGYLAIPVHAPHPNAAILYTLYALSAEGQEKLAWELIGDDLADLPTAHMHEQAEAIRAKGIQPIAVTIAWWRAHPGIDKANAELAKLVARQ